MSYGKELWCGDSIVTGRYSTGVLTVALALYRRLITPRGDLGFIGGFDEGGDAESAYGFDLSGYIGEVGAEAAAASIPMQVKNELSKDGRVSEVSVELFREKLAAGLENFRLVINVVLKDSSEPFAFVVGVNSVTSKFLGLAA